MKNLIILFGVILGVIIVFFYPWFRYRESINEVNAMWYEEEYLGKEIIGVLKSMNDFDNDPFKVVLSIKNQRDEFDVTYGVTCIDKNFRSFVSPGDSVFKSSGSKTIRFCKSQPKECKNFELNFCGMLDK
jgi:hypothetical protein